MTINPEGRYGIGRGPGGSAPIEPGSASPGEGVTLRGLLGRSAAAFADRCAVSDPARKRSVTYSTLHANAQEIGRALLESGVFEGDRIGIYAPKSIASVAAIFGVLGIGGAYVPIDVSAPLPRTVTILADCSVAALIVAGPLLGSIRRALNLTAEARAIGSQEDDLFVVRIAVTADVDQPSVSGLAYVLYTSGSSGTPKGIAHAHSSARAFVDWCSEVFLPTAEDRFSSHAPFHFDLSIFDLFVCIKHGAELVLIDESIVKRPAQLAHLIAEERISIWYSTPSVLQMLLRWGEIEHREYDKLRLVLFAGEVFPINRLRDLVRVLPTPRYFNLYGPTETNVCAFHEVRQSDLDAHEELPIGKPCSGDRARSVTRDGAKAGMGEIGELYVCGPSVMLGYWADRLATEAAFHVDPDGSRWYRTGDLVELTAEDSYRFRGRRDRMVKRRGYRIELGEIEAALARHHQIAGVAVIARQTDGDVTLTAFVAWTGTERLSVVALKQYCATALPLYMVPDKVVVLDALPMTSTDKVDYRRLQASA